MAPFTALFCDLFLTPFRPESCTSLTSAAILLRTWTASSRASTGTRSSSPAAASGTSCTNTSSGRCVAAPFLHYIFVTFGQVRCLWEDVHARAGLFRSARDAYGNLREPMRAEFKSPARLQPMRLDVDSSLKGGSSSNSALAPQTINQQAAATWKDHDDAVAVHTSPKISTHFSYCFDKVNRCLLTPYP